MVNQINGLIVLRHGISVCFLVHFRNDHVEPTILKHSSTVGELAIDKKEKRLAVANGGTTIWEKGDGMEIQKTNLDFYICNVQS